MNINQDLHQYNQEEADTGIVLHAVDVSQRNPFSDLLISCSDTDVLLILLHYFEDLCSSCIFKTRTSEIKLRTVYESLGREICKALVGFHSFTGCDQTGRFYGHSKLSCWKVFIACNETTLGAFQELRDTLTDNVRTGLEQFVMKLYCGKKSLSVSDLAELRWRMFSKYQCESEKLPPTKSTLEQKILRAHYTALTWKSSHISSPILPNPEEYGWKWNDSNKTYDPVMTNNPPAPETIIELSMCQCKTGCSNQRCRCKKNDLLCTEMCLCVNCINDGSDNDSVHSDAEIDDDSE